MLLLHETSVSAHWRVPGKINLYLEVLNRRADGYHDIETIFQSVTLWDDVVVDISSPGSEITLHCSDPRLESPDNLAVRAARLLRRESGIQSGARIWINKRIPVGGGMAGGSADAAAVLVALNRLWGLGYPAGTLEKLALELGSDVPFCLSGGTAAASGRGERLCPLPEIPSAPHVVLVFPGFISETKKVYQHPALRPCGERPGDDGWTPTFAGVLERLRRGRVSEVVFNRLETPVFELYPALRGVRDFLRDAGCMAAAVSGSGSTVFGLCGAYETALAIRDQAHERMRMDAEAVSMWHPVQHS
ncbi:MAG TPA: 4-(cytidine 5'-diphospho)-2-C-methyl-D-erythritol kinase, partial [Candidatus Hydrogenedentes bacterium]|nr:4-(cytidine 5'-diphospho)-2-C-methyl-D-erythritol kinase [Candidatus Hydrogenedentota bacterium]